MKDTIKVYIKTYGCQMNERDSEALAGKLASLGYEITANENEGDVLIFNTCSVREQAERKAIGKIGFMKKLKLSRPDVLIGVIGCMAQNRGEELFKELPHLDFVLGTGQLHTLPEVIESLRSERRHISLLEQSTDVLTEMGYHHTPANRRFQDSIAITRGCNRFCSYCIVPYVRGREISRERADIIAEAKDLVADGVREILLLGQNVAAYGWGGNINPPPDDISPFADLLAELNDINGLYRIRYTSPYPSYFNAKLIQAIGALPKVCKSVHLPLQSGSNKILKAMNRQYTAEKYYEIVEALRNVAPEITFSTDIIVGFPGETDADFDETRKMMQTVQYDNAYIFKYSPRKGTRSAECPDDVPQEVKEERNQILLSELQRSSLARNRSRIGKWEEILVEGPSRRNPARFVGRSDGARSVMFAPDNDTRIGELKQVKIAHATAMTLFAEGIPDLDIDKEE